MKICVSWLEVGGLKPVELWRSDQMPHLPRVGEEVELTDVCVVGVFEVVKIRHIVDSAHAWQDIQIFVKAKKDGP